MASPSDGAAQVALVTGASGFTGRYVVANLQSRGYRVVQWGHEVGVSRAIDLTDRAAVLDAVSIDRPDVVVHLAAISFVAHGDAEAMYKVNVLGTRNLLEGLAALEGEQRKVLLASSANVYGNAEGAVDESLPPSPQNDYAVSKLAMEYMARLWSDRLRITTVRPFNYTGVGQAEKFLLPKIVAHFRRRAEVMELGNLDVSRDFYDVRYVAEAYGRLLDKPDAYGLFNICSGVEYSLADVVKMMEGISGHSLQVRVNPSYIRANEVKRLRGDNSRLRDAIGELPTFSLEDTLRWMYSADESAPA